MEEWEGRWNINQQAEGEDACGLKWWTYDQYAPCLCCGNALGIERAGCPNMGSGIAAG